MPYVGGDEDRREPFFYYRADHQRWCPQVPLATDWCAGNHSAFRHNGGYCTPILDEAMAA